MMTKALFVGLALIGAIAPLQNADGKRPWDVARYTECLTTSGTDDLAPDLLISTQGCRSGRDPVDKLENIPNDAKSLAWVTGAKHKDDTKLAFVAIAFGTRVERSATYVGGNSLTNDAGGRIVYRSVYAMVGGIRQQLTTAFEPPSAPSCSSMWRGAITMNTCGYLSAGVVELPAELLAEISATYASTPEANFRFRVEADGGSLSFNVPVAEIEAVRLAVFPPEANTAQPASPNK